MPNHIFSKTTKLFLIFQLFLVSGCHGVESEVELHPLPVSPQNQTVVDVFGSYTCGICNHELPELHERMVKFNQDRLNKVQVRLFVVSGNGGSAATQTVAENYAKDLGLTTFQPFADNRCRGQYQEYYPNQGCYVPAHVILTGETKRVVYPQGSVNLDKFINDLKQAVGE